MIEPHGRLLPAAFEQLALPERPRIRRPLLGLVERLQLVELQAGRALARRKPRAAEQRLEERRARRARPKRDAYSAVASDAKQELLAIEDAIERAKGRRAAIRVALRVDERRDAYAEARAAQGEVQWPERALARGRLKRVAQRAVLYPIVAHDRRALHVERRERQAADALQFAQNV